MNLKKNTSFGPSGGGPRQVVRQDMTVLEESSISELGSNGSYVLKVVKCSGQLGPVSDPMNMTPKLESVQDLNFRLGIPTKLQL